MEIKPFEPCRNCDQDRFNSNIKRAKQLEAAGATEIEVWYCVQWDFVYTGFTFRGKKMQIRTYKLIALRAGDGKTRLFKDEWEFELFIKRYDPERN